MSLPTVTHNNYLELYEKSINEPEKFWAEQAKRLYWFMPFTAVKNTSFEPGNISIKWFEGATFNVCHNCVDRHIDDKADHPAIIIESDDPQKNKTLTFRDLRREVAKCANALLAVGVEKGDRVLIYLPMSCDAVISMLACARIGAVHCVVFAGFSAQSLASRIDDCTPKLIITTNSGTRGEKTIPFYDTVKTALELSETKSIQCVLMIQRPYQVQPFGGINFYDYDMLVNKQISLSFCEEMSAEDPLFILYTSGSTGKPKGLVHTSGGYLLYAAMTHEYVFNSQPDDVYWCTADVGWITGHTYGIYGPLCNGVTTVIFEGVPTYPTPSRFWEIIDRHKVTVFYTAPTALRSLKSMGDQYLESTSRSSLRVIGTVGEPIDPTTWQWYFDMVGNQKAYVVDTWWQTETGGHMITPMARYGTPNKPGSVALPFFGVKPVLLDNDGNVITGEGRGNLCIADSWPGQARTMFNAHDRFEETYFSTFKGMYTTGDGAERDADGYYWITGRVDDVLNVSGHRLGTNELESALAGHDKVAEAAVVGYPHPIKGQGIYAYVVLYDDADANDALSAKINAHLRSTIGPIASIDTLQWTTALPKTRSGKVMRRILRKIAEGELDSIGDVSTLADPSVVDEIIKTHKELQEQPI